MTALTQRLRALVKAAMPGPWDTSPASGTQVWTRDFALAYVHGRTSDEARGNAAYLAALDPATVMALLDVADALEEIAGPSVAATASHSYDAAYRRCRSIAERALAALRRLDAAGGG